MLQSELQRGGSLLPGFVLPGKCSGHLDDFEHMHNTNKNTLVSTLYLHYCIVVAWPLHMRKGGTPLKLLGLPAASAPVVHQPLMSAHQSCTPGGIDPPLTGTRDPVLADGQSL